VRESVFATDENAAVRKRLLNVHHYMKMAEIGLLTEKPKVELINGEIFNMALTGTEHYSVVNQLNMFFVMAVQDRAIVSVQNSLRLGDLSQPEPDLCQLRPCADFYAKQTPEASKVLLLVEVAQSSLHFDSTTKARLYAMHGVEEYWLIDLPNRKLRVFKEPEAEGYGQISTFRASASFWPTAFPDIKLDLSGFFHI